MSLIRMVLVATPLLAACGPDADDDSKWMLDTFSESRGAGELFGYGRTLGKFTFEPDGVGSRTNVGECGGDVDVTPFVWEKRDGAIAIVPNPGEDFVFNTNNEEWRFTRTDRCASQTGGNEIQWQKIREGEVVLNALVFRGDVCLEQFEPSPEDCPEGVQCDNCRTVWCDDPPPPCEQQSS